LRNEVDALKQNIARLREELGAAADS